MDYLHMLSADFNIFLQHFNSEVTILVSFYATLFLEIVDQTLHVFHLKIYRLPLRALTILYLTCFFP